jgi:hypothetical protein
VLAGSHTSVRVELILAWYGRKQGNGGTPLGSSRQGLLGAARVRTRRLLSFLPAPSLIHVRGISASEPQGDIRGRPFLPCRGNSAKSDVACWRLEHDPEKWVPVFRKDHAQSKRWSGMTIRRNVISRWMSVRISALRQKIGHPEGRPGSKPDSVLDAALLVSGEMPKLQICFRGGLPVRARWRIGKL